MCHQETLTLITHSPEETHAWGVALGRALRPGQLVALYGDLGAGKTTLTRGVVIGLGSNDPVTSPTFTLVNEYQGAAGLRIFHIDAYRLGENAAHEAEASGIGDLLYDGEAVVIVEWPERLADLLPDDYLAVHLSPLASDDNARCIECQCRGPAGAHTLAALAARQITFPR